MASFIVCPDGTILQPHGGFAASDLGGRPFIADSAEEALHLAYAEGYAQFPATIRFDQHADPVVWSEMRDARILAAARRVIETGGMRSLTRKAIALAANVAPGTISNYGRTNLKANGTPTEGYRERILAGLMADAIDKADIAMIRVGIADGCLRGEDVPEALRAAVGL